MKKILLTITVLLAVGGGAFYVGMKYGESSRQNFMRQNFVGERGMTARTGEPFLSGEVIAKDEQSLTLKTPDGGSRIIFFSEATQIMISEKGLATDLEIGKNITINGQSNSDGSVTAAAIQIRPNDLTPSPR